jgi:hypothetical protein
MGHQPSPDTPSIIRQPSDTMLFGETIQSPIDGYAKDEHLYDNQMPDVQSAMEMSDSWREPSCTRAVSKLLFTPTDEEELVFNSDVPQNLDTAETMVQAQAPITFRREGDAGMPQSPLLRKEHERSGTIQVPSDAEVIDMPRELTGNPKLGSRFVFRSPSPSSRQKQDAICDTGDMNGSSLESSIQQDQEVGNGRAKDFEWPQDLPRPTASDGSTPQQVSTSNRYYADRGPTAEPLKWKYKASNVQTANGVALEDRHTAARVIRTSASAVSL